VQQHPSLVIIASEEAYSEQNYYCTIYSTKHCLNYLRTTYRDCYRGSRSWGKPGNPIWTSFVSLPNWELQWKWHRNKDHFRSLNLGRFGPYKSRSRIVLMSTLCLSTFRSLRSCGNGEKRLLKVGRDARRSEFKISATSAERTKLVQQHPPLVLVASEETLQGKRNILKRFYLLYITIY
jgi:hypothetical protein